MTPCSKLYSKIFEQTINADITIEFMNNFANQISKKTVVILNNTPIHKSKKFISNLSRWREQYLYVYFLPPYSTELNKIDILWRFIKYEWIPLDALSKLSKSQRTTKRNITFVWLKTYH